MRLSGPHSAGAESFRFPRRWKTTVSAPTPVALSSGNQYLQVHKQMLLFNEGICMSRNILGWRVT